MNKKPCNFHTPRNTWLSLEEYDDPCWAIDYFEDEYLLVCNKEEFNGEGFRRVQTPQKRGELFFDSYYGDEGDTEIVTHFMLIDTPINFKGTYDDQT